MKSLRAIGLFLSLAMGAFAYDNLHVTANSISNVYDGEMHSVAVCVEELVPYAVYYSTNAFMWSAMPPAFKDCCVDQVVWYEVSAMGYETVTGRTYVTIYPREISLHSPSHTWEYDGFYHSDTNIVATGLVSGDNIMFEDTTSVREVGCYPNRFTWRFSNPEVAKNYNVTTSFGELTITSVQFDAPVSGGGTEESPFVVSNAASLIAFRDWINTGGTRGHRVYVRQTADIDMSVTNEWVGIGSRENMFWGTYDGDNHVISDLKLLSHNSTTWYGGLFGDATNTIVRNLRIENVATDCSDFYGAAVVGQLHGGTLQNVTATGKLSGSYNVGGLVCRGAEDKVTYDSCTNRVDLKTTYTKAGGFLSYTMDAAQLYFTNCLNAGSVTIEHSVRRQEAAGAGFVGYSCAPVLMYDCENTGDIHVSALSNAVSDRAYNSVIAAGAVAWINSCNGSDASIRIRGFKNTGSIVAENHKDIRYAIAGGVLGTPNWYYGYFRCPFVLDDVEVMTTDIHAYGTNAVVAAFFGGNTRYSSKTGNGTRLLYGRAPTSIQPFGNWDFEVGGYNATRKDGDYTIYYVRNSTDEDDPQGGSGSGDDDDGTIQNREKTFAEIWGAWSSENGDGYVPPATATGLDDLARIAWRTRDSMMMNGQFGCLPPTEKPIVMSVGTFSYGGVLKGKNDEELQMDQECGVAVWHVRIFEDPDRGLLRMKVGDVEVEPIAVPMYDHAAWVQGVYGEPPKWLSESERRAWYAKRSRSRLEMFATLVPSADYATYVENIEADELDVAQEDKDKILIREFAPAKSTNALHVLNVRMPDAGSVVMLGLSDLGGTNWAVNGVGTLPAGRSANGVSSDSAAYFVKVVAGSIGSELASADSDGDGISDVLETYVFHTDPTKASTAGDGLSDGERIFRYELSTVQADSDGDGFDDEEEIALGQDPKVATPGASTTIRYTYDDDDRLTGTYFGNNGRTTTKLSPVGNPLVIEKRGAK